MSAFLFSALVLTSLAYFCWTETQDQAPRFIQIMSCYPDIKAVLAQSLNISWVVIQFPIRRDACQLIPAS